MPVTIVGGGGTVGSTVAYTLAIERPDVEIRICDVDGDASWGHATDARHARCHAAHALDTAPTTGDVRAVDPGADAVHDTDCVVVTASVPRPDDGDERGGRETFWPANRDVADEIADWLSNVDPCPVLVVTNPVDRMVSRLFERTDWPRSRFLGYSLSETARLADAIASHTGADDATVDCPVLGEHGEHIVPAFSRATVDGAPLELSAEERAEMTDYARSIPYDVIQRRGTRDGSRWVTGRGAELVVEAILDDGAAEPVCLSTPLDGEYDLADVSLGVPVRLSSEGVARIEEWDLAEREYRALHEAARSLAE